MEVDESMYNPLYIKEHKGRSPMIEDNAGNPLAIDDGVGDSTCHPMNRDRGRESMYVARSSHFNPVYIPGDRQNTHVLESRMCTSNPFQSSNVRMSSYEMNVDPVPETQAQEKYSAGVHNHQNQPNPPVQRMQISEKYPYASVLVTDFTQAEINKEKNNSSTESHSDISSPTNRDDTLKRNAGEYEHLEPIRIRITRLVGGMNNESYRGVDDDSDNNGDADSEASGDEFGFTDDDMESDGIDKEWHTCKICQKVFFNKKSHTGHMRKCHGEKRSCGLCSKVYYKKRALAEHMNAVHFDAKSYLCDICGYMNSCANKFKTHMLSHGEAKLFICYVCGKTFTNSSNLKSHLMMHNDEKPFECKECGRKFRRNHELRCHIRIHTKEKPYKCETCEKSFTQSSSLKTHQRMHMGERLHGCNICEERFGHKYQLQLHMRTHTKEKPFHCKTCDKSFTQASSLKTHMKTHNKNKDNLCNLCGDSFALKNTLKIHLMRHRGEKPHKCTSCEKSFTQSSTLKIHMQIHIKNASAAGEEKTGESPEENANSITKNHKCELCGTCFALKNTLKVHLMRHKGEKPHKCEVCQKSFTQSSTLKIHMRTHTGDKPYTCDVCGMQFTYNYILQKHILTHKDDVLEYAGYVSDDDDIVEQLQEVNMPVEAEVIATETEVIATETEVIATKTEVTATVDPNPCEQVENKEMTIEEMKKEISRVLYEESLNC